MKKTFINFIFIVTLLETSCTTPIQIGTLNIVSTRNIDINVRYKLISNYSGGSRKELKSSRAITLQDAIDQTVRKIPGGEYMTNAKIYLIIHRLGKDKMYYAVEGDVWGSAGEATYRGFKVGDKVTWKNKKNIVSKIKGDKKSYLTGIISHLKDDKKCLIKTDGTGEIIEMEYDEITK